MGESSSNPWQKTNTLFPTAERIEPKRKRKDRRAAASLLTGDWNKPKLGTPGLLGVSWDFRRLRP
jgi:hypothetical protein